MYFTMRARARVSTRRGQSEGNWVQLYGSRESPRSVATFGFAKFVNPPPNRLRHTVYIISHADLYIFFSRRHEHLFHRLHKIDMAVDVDDGPTSTFPQLQLLNIEMKFTDGRPVRSLPRLLYINNPRKKSN